MHRVLSSSSSFNFEVQTRMKKKVKRMKLAREIRREIRREKKERKGIINVCCTFITIARIKNKVLLRSNLTSATHLVFDNLPIVVFVVFDLVADPVIVASQNSVLKKQLPDKVMHNVLKIMC